MKIQNKKAFTLIELIIVITILSILAVIGFISYQSYTQEARDANRITTLKTIHNGLIISYIKSQVYPDPDDYLDVVGISKQGYIGDNVSKIIKGEGFEDPKNKSKYLYSIDYTGKKIQLSRFLEGKNQNLIFSSNNTYINETFADDLDYLSMDTYVLGDKVCLLLDTRTKKPINKILIGSLDLTNDDNEYSAICSNESNTGTLSGSGQNLLNNILIVQNSCKLGNTIIKSGEELLAYNSDIVGYNETCEPIVRTCNNGILTGNNTYLYDSCSQAYPLNCNPTTYNGYNIPAINHAETQNITKSITGGISDINVTCTNGVLSYSEDNITCDSTHVLDNFQCLRDLCVGTNPVGSILHGTQAYNNSWSYNTIPGICTYICKSGYYWNGSSCISASPGYYVPSRGRTSQTICPTGYTSSAGATSCTIIKYTVSFNGNGGTGQSPTSKIVNYNTAIGTLPTNPILAGYAFNGWYTSTTGGTKITTRTLITSNVTFYAQWLSSLSYCQTKYPLNSVIYDNRSTIPYNGAAYSMVKGQWSVNGSYCKMRAERGNHTAYGHRSNMPGGW